MTDDHKLGLIRKRTETQQSRYGFRWNQLLRDRRDLLDIIEHVQDIATSNVMSGREKLAQIVRATEGRCHD